MKPQLTFDDKSFGREINQLRVLLKKSGPEVVKGEGKLAVRDAIKMTPPCGRHAITESWSTQRKLGMATVARELGKMFIPLMQIPVVNSEDFKRAAGYLRSYIRAKNKQAIRKILTDFGYNPPVILDEATEEVHNQARDSKGRIRRGVRYLVLEARSIARLIKLRQGHVGKGKAGWMDPARALGVKVPDWISTHAGPGVWHDGTLNGYSPYIDIGNLVGHANDAGQRMGIMESVMRQRRRSMRIRIEKMVAYLAKKKPLPFLP